jgi:hypothetical protein
MVDLAFLITFFMLTTTLSKPQSMPLGLPDLEDDPTDKPIKVDENRTLTVLLGIMIKWFITWDLLATLIAGQLIFLMERGIRKELLKRKISSRIYSG